MGDRAPDPLLDPLDALASLGFERPVGWTVQQFLDHLVDQRLLDRGAVKAYLDHYQRARFGAGEASSDGGVAIGRLREEIETLGQLDESDRAEVAASFDVSDAPAPAPRVPAPPATAARAVAPQVEDVDLPGDEADRVEPPAAGRWGRPWVIVLALILWTPLAVLAGYIWSPTIDDLLDVYRGTPQVSASWDDNVRVQLRSARDKATAHPDSPREWEQYATFAVRQGLTSEGIVAYRHLISLEPDNAEAINNLAWLLLTAEDRFVRDPVQGLELAERAYALEASPHITDTLAEAAYQNGDYHRAVALEEDALSRAERGKSFYEEQLRKFRLAAENAPPVAPEGE